jgi:hypothetical protein
MILKIFSPKNLAKNLAKILTKNLALFVQTTATFAKI